MTRASSKYLESYADQRLWEAKNILCPCHYVLVIPAFNEDEKFVENLLGLKKNLDKPTLIIVVINGPHDAEVSQVHANLSLIDRLKTLGECPSTAGETTLVVEGNFHLLIAGPFTLERSQGVGLARKIGADFAAHLVYEAMVECPIIFCTDADAILPSDYFSRGEKAIGLGDAAAVFPFIHECPTDERQAQAIAMYEQRLNRYVAGLKSAASPYAFHTMGSTMALSARHYAKVRGFPKISAGEDFYVLNKLRKLGPVISLSGEPIKLSARVSDRVLFGTGPALAKILQNTDPKDAPIFYDPKVFEYLRVFLSHAEARIQAGFCDVSADLDAFSQDAFYSLDKGQLERSLALRTSIKDRIKAFHEYFDAFKTLKFIHHLRDSHFPMQTFYY